MKIAIYYLTVNGYISFVTSVKDGVTPVAMTDNTILLIDATGSVTVGADTISYDKFLLNIDKFQVYEDALIYKGSESLSTLNDRVITELSDIANAINRLNKTSIFANL